MTYSLETFLVDITDFGDCAVLGAIVISSAAYLWFSGCRKGAAALILSLITASAGVGLAKIVLLGCGGFFRQYGIQSPSGHSALSLAVLMTGAILISSQLNGWRSMLLRLALACLIVAIATTRVMLGFHSVIEVVIGLLAGSIAVWLASSFIHHGKRIPPFNAGALTFSALFSAIIFHGTRLPAEELIDLMASHFKAYAHCT